MFRDEAVNLIREWTEAHGAQILTFAEYIMQNPPTGLDMSALDVLVHGHCHQKAMGVAQYTVDAVKSVLGANAQMIDSSCCGMAGSFGYQVETANDGEQALLLANEFQPQCVLIDVRMPGIGGVEAARQLKQFFPDARLIFMSAYFADGVIDEVQAMGPVELLPKPLDIEQLLTLIGQP